MIAIRQNASALETFAASEVRKYVYLRTGELLKIEKGRSGGERLVVALKDRQFCGELGQDLEAQQFLLKSETKARKTWWIVGGDAVGTLYGGYRFAEQLGIQFGLEADAIPDAPLTGGLPQLNETGKPRFALRGLQPFHDFSVGPDWWNAANYKSVLSQMAKLRMNFIGLHTYPSWNPAAGPEANVWLGLPEDVDANGNVRFGYEAGVVTSRKGWNVTPFPTSQYACGAGLFFEDDDYGPDFMLDCLDWPRTEQAAAAMFNRYGDFQKTVFEHARRLGIQTCVGTELPLGIPKALSARLESRGLKPEDPAVRRRLYEGTFLRLKRKLPLDYFWLWTPEVWLDMEPGCRNWEMTSKASVEADLPLAEAAAKSVQAPFGLATCGWRLGAPDDALWMDRRAPRSWAASAIGTHLGQNPVEKAFGAMKGRPRWVIGWAEDDGTAGAHCCTCWDLQLWVERMFVHSAQAFQYGCEGMMAIHWRTAAISPNIMALSQAAWEFAQPGAPIDSALPGKRPCLDAYWAEWGRGQFGGEAGARVGRALQKLDGSHIGINALVAGGAKTTEAKIADFFGPLREMEALRPLVQGAGNLERLDYWLNFIRASELRVRTWVLASRLAGKMNEVNAFGDSDKKRSVVRAEILPLRLELARTYEHLISAYVQCARSPGEIGTISSIESGSRKRIVCAQDAAIAKVLGQPLPAEVCISTAYRGVPRIFLSAKTTSMLAGHSEEIRAFVLSAQKCAALDLCWRPLGQGRFKKVAANHRNRQAYSLTLPAQRDTIEYYLEAVLEDGQKVMWPATAPKINEAVSALTVDTFPRNLQKPAAILRDQ